MQIGPKGCFYLLLIVIVLGVLVGTLGDSGGTP